MKKIAPPTVFYQAESYRPEDSVGYLMRQILNRVAHEIERQLAHTDLTNAQWIPLFKLYSGHATTVAELAREFLGGSAVKSRELGRIEVGRGVKNQFHFLSAFIGGQLML